MRKWSFLLLVAMGLLFSLNVAQSQPQPDGRKINNLHREAGQLKEQGKYEEAIAKYEEILKMAPNLYGALYEMARCYARWNKKDKALEYLKKTIEAGFTNMAYIKGDSELDNIKGEEGFKKLIAGEKEVTDKASEEKVKDWLKRLGKNYTTEIWEEVKVKVVTGVSGSELEWVKKGLPDYAKAQWKHLFKKPDHYTILVLVKEQDWGTKAGPEGSGGVYQDIEQTLLARSVVAIRHEYTHALHNADMQPLGQEHPIWIVEGFACLFESSIVKDGKATGISNYRLGELKQYLKGRNYIEWSELMQMDGGAYMTSSELCYAESQYILYYLQEKGLLEKWYKEYKTNYKDDQSGVKAIEKTLGGKLSEIETEWKEWIKNLPNPPDLGLSITGAENVAVKVTAVAPGSEAEKSGIRKGDLITQFDGVRIMVTKELKIMIPPRKAEGGEVKVKIQRDGQETTLTLILGGEK